MTILFEMVGAAFLLIMTLMTIAWIIYYFQGNATIVDLAWSLSFILVALAYLLISDGNLLRGVIITIMVFIWAGRLHWHLWQRYRPNAEDPRYSLLRKRIGPAHIDFKFFLMFIFQGLLALVLTVPFLLIDRNSHPWSHWEIWGILVWAIGITGEFFADKQLKEFKKKPGNANKVCDKGLWHYTRHPNYFFEFIVWVGFALFALNATFGWLALSAPIIMFYLLNFVTGIPPNEEVALKTQGDAYAEYQETTSPFIPWLKK